MLRERKKQFILIIETFFDLWLSLCIQHTNCLIYYYYDICPTKWQNGLKNCVNNKNKWRVNRVKFFICIYFEKRITINQSVKFMYLDYILEKRNKHNTISDTNLMAWIDFNLLAFFSQDIFENLVDDQLLFMFLIFFFTSLFK